MGALAIRCGLAPSVVWAEDPRDLATLAALLEAQADAEGG